MKYQPNLHCCAVFCWDFWVGSTLVQRASRSFDQSKRAGKAGMRVALWWQVKLVWLACHQLNGEMPFHHRRWPFSPTVTRKQTDNHSRWVFYNDEKQTKDRKTCLTRILSVVSDWVPSEQFRLWDLKEHEYQPFKSIAFMQTIQFTHLFWRSWYEYIFFFFGMLWTFLSLQSWTVALMLSVLCLNRNFCCAASSSVLQHSSESKQEITKPVHWHSLH